MANIAKRIKESTPLDGLQVLSVKTGMKDAVFVTGSFLGGRVFGSKENPVVPFVTARLLDKGTKKSRKDAIHSELESMGAEVSFSSDALRVRFMVRCQKKTLNKVMKLVAEQLKSPAFLQEEFKKEIDRVISESKQNRENTQDLAKRALLRNIFSPEHPNYVLDMDEVISYARKMKVKQVRDFHKKTYGLGTLTVVGAGDIIHKELENIVKRVFSKWQRSALRILPEQPNRKKQKREKIDIQVPNKGTVDVFIGQGVDIDKTHPDHILLSFAMAILGRGFLGRLMANVRDKKGLTYGATSLVDGVDDRMHGYWFAWSMFAPTLLEQGEAAVIEEIEKIVKTIPGQKEVELFKGIAASTFEVALESAEGFAPMVLKNVEQGFPKEYFDEHLERLAKITSGDLKGAIRKHMKPDRLIVARAGTIR